MLTDAQAGFRPYKRCVGQVAALCETISRWRGKYSAREENAAQPVPRDVDVAREENAAQPVPRDVDSAREDTEQPVPRDVDVAREENAAQPVPRDVDSESDDVVRIRGRRPLPAEMDWESDDLPPPTTHQQSPSSVYLCFVDFQKAYDRVPHEALLAKLRYYGVTGRTYSFIETLYSRSVMQIRVGESLSEPVELKRGLRQGCPMSPILFSIYINDILPEGIWNKRITNVSSI